MRSQQSTPLRSLPIPAKYTDHTIPLFYACFLPFNTLLKHIEAAWKSFIKRFRFFTFMPAPRHKSTRFRKMHVRVPGGSTHLHYKDRNPKIAHCAHCRGELKGIPRIKATAMKRMPKTQKRPERPYGGMLCSRCMRAHIIKNIQA